MASLTLPPAPPNPRQDAIDLHKAFKGPLRHRFPLAPISVSPRNPSRPPRRLLFDFGWIYKAERAGECGVKGLYVSRRSPALIRLSVHVRLGGVLRS